MGPTGLPLSPWRLTRREGLCVQALGGLVRAGLTWQLRSNNGSEADAPHVARREARRPGASASPESASAPLAALAGATACAWPALEDVAGALGCTEAASGSSVATGPQGRRRRRRRCVAQV